MNIPFSPPDMTDLEIEGVIEAIRSGWITTGPKVKKLENLLADYVDRRILPCRKGGMT